MLYVPDRRGRYDRTRTRRGDGSALANETRYELPCLLVAADGEVCACEFVGGVDASQSTVSRGLSTLYEAGLANRRKEDQWRYYSPTEAAERLLETVDAIREGRKFSKREWTLLTA